MDLRNKLATFLAGIVVELTKTAEDRKREKEREDQFKQIRKVIESMDMQVVIMKRDDYYKLSGTKDPLKSPSGKNKMPVSELKDMPLAKQMMEEMGIENFYLEDYPYYGEEDITDIFNTNPSLLKAPPIPIGMERKMPVPNSNVAFDMEDMGAYSYLDSAYNFGVVYMSGGKRSNVFTACSVDSDGKMYIHEQKQFTVKTITDVIDNCDKFGKKFELDSIIVVRNDVSKKAIPFIEKGLNDDKIKVIDTKESSDYEGDLQEFLPFMGTGEVLVGLGPWLQKLQIEMSNHFMRHPQQRDSFPVSFTNLKAFINSVKYWQDNRDNDVFIRDLGIIDDKETEV